MTIFRNLLRFSYNTTISRNILPLQRRTISLSSFNACKKQQDHVNVGTIGHVDHGKPPINFVKS